MKRTVFTVNAKSPKTLLNAMRDISVKKVKIKGCELTFTVNATDKNLVLDILEQLLYNDFVCVDISLGDNFKNNASKIVSVLLFIVIALAPYFFTVGVSANTTDKDILNILEKYDKIMLKQNVDVKGIEEQIFEVQGVSFCEVSVNSGKIEVFVKGSLKPEEQQKSHELKSKYKGEITKIITLSGTPKVAVGDRVDVGQMLILGVIEVENKEDKKLVNAVGQVYGIAEKEEVFNVPKMQIISTRTGNTVKRNTLSLFGLSIKRKVPFDNFEEVYKNSNLTKGYFLPLSIKSSTFFEINREIVETDLVKAQEYLQSLTKLQEEQSGGKVISQEISVLEMPDFYEITVKTKTERNFC